jgi:hypothetical protein
MKTYVIEMCDMIKVTTTEKVDGEVGKLTEAFTEVKNSLIVKTEAILLKNKKSISNIKNTCALFFDKYDQALSYMQRRFDNINDTFEDYENNFMGPTKMREGRMHAIEAKLREQEDSRETEFKYLKLLLKKMLTAFEQSVFVSGTDKIVPSKSVVYHPQTERQEQNLSPPEKTSSAQTEKLEIVRQKANKTMTDNGDNKFLPSLQSKINTTKLSFNNNLDISGILEPPVVAKPKLKSINVSNMQSFDYGPFGSAGDKQLHKRILFLKETLDIDPNLEENRRMLIKYFNEPALIDEETRKVSPKDRSLNYKSVAQNDEYKLNMINFKTAEPVKKQSEVKFKRKTQSLIRKQFDQNEKNSNNQSSDMIVSPKNNEKLHDKSMFSHTSASLFEKNMNFKQSSNNKASLINFKIQGVVQK